MVSFADVKKAFERILPYVNRTPVLTSTTLNEMVGAQLYFKCENFQKVGAFKFRGATNAVFSLSEADAEKGVVTHSSGNHAAALALAAKKRTIPAWIVMPFNAPAVKVAAVKHYGGRITFCEPTQKAREETAEKIITEQGATFIHPYNNEKVIAGQGTAALELMQEISDLDFIFVPVGGGGLLSGTAIAATALKKDIRVCAGEPKNADDAYRSVETGKIVFPENPNTIADGLKTSLGEITFPIIQKLVHEIILVSETEIINAMRVVLERMKIVIEPSSAVALAAVIKSAGKVRLKKVGVIFSGGNVDFERFFKSLNERKEKI